MNDYNLKKVLCQLNQWCAANNISVQSVYDECHGMTLQEQVYYLLGVVKEAVNQVVENTDAFQELYNFVHDYFDNLDVQEQINNKLEQMFESGQLNELLNLFIPYVTPEMYGAKGDGVTDDTKAFLNALDSGNPIRLSAKTYVVTFSNFNLSEKQLFGSGKENSVIINSGSSDAFGIVGTNTRLSDFKLVSNTACDILTFSNSFTNHCIEHMNFLGVSGCTAMHFNLTSGTTGGLINDVRVQNCDYAMVFDINNYLTAQIVKNCNFNSFYISGIKINGDSLFSHSAFECVSMYCNHDGTSGIELSANYGITFSNCNVFNDNPSGIAYSFKLSAPENIEIYKLIKIDNGIYEGNINVALMNSMIINNALFVIRPYNGASTTNVLGNYKPENVLETMPKIYNLDGNVIVNNITLSYGIDNIGKYLLLSNNSESIGYLRITSPFIYGEYISCYIETDTFTNYVIFDDGTDNPETSRVISHDNVYRGVVYGTPKADGISNNIQLNVNPHTDIKVYALSVTKGLNLQKICAPFINTYRVQNTFQTDANGIANLSEYENVINVRRVTNETGTAILAITPQNNLVAITNTNNSNVILQLLISDLLLV